MRQVAIFEPKQASAQQATERMKSAIDSPRGRALYGRRIATVEPVFANLRHNKRLNRLPCAGDKGEHAVAAVLPGAQHREVGQPRLSMIGPARGKR